MVKEALSFTLNNCCFTMWYLDKLQANHWNKPFSHSRASWFEPEAEICKRGN